MQTCYLVDFENVTSGGLDGIDSLPAGDTVYLLFTNNPKVSLDRLANSLAALHLISVPAGSQSLDMHLISLAGYLAGVLPQDSRIVIVSRDTDYDNPAAFWNKRLGCLKITRQEAIVPSSRHETADPQPAAVNPGNDAQAVPGQVPSSSSAPAAAKAGRSSRNRNRRQRRQRAVQQTMNDIPTVTFPQPDPSTADSASRQTPATEAIQAQTTAVDSVRQPIPAETVSAASEAAAVEEIHDQRSRRIMKALIDGSIPSQQIDMVTSAIARLTEELGSKNLKLAAYHELVKLYGRKEGKPLYDLIKPVIDDPSGV